MLHTVQPDVFPQLQSMLAPAAVARTEFAVVARPLLKYVLWPSASSGFCSKACLPPLDVAALKERTLSLPGMTEARKQAEKAFSVPSGVSSLARSEDEIVFLGTGSSRPSRNRNVSSFLLRLCAGGNIFFDSGEGTYGQLLQCLGAAATDDVLRSLTCIYISHLHADHHLGLVRLLLERQILMGPEAAPSLVVAPTPVLNWLQAYAQLQAINYEALDCRDLEDSQSVLPLALSSSKITGLRCVPVDHCYMANGVVLTHADGWKLVYSGDTRPCPALVAAGADADILVHEATFSDMLQTDAVQKKHSTTSEAIGVAQDMRAKVVLLTHFSQRYPNIPVVADDAKTSVAGFAFDYMRLRFSQLAGLPSLLPALKIIFEAQEPDEGGANVMAPLWPMPTQVEMGTGAQDPESSPHEQKISPIP